MVQIAKLVRKKMGEVLVDEGLVKEDQVQEALRRQRATGESFGEILVSMGKCAGLVGDRRALSEQVRTFGTEAAEGNRAVERHEHELVSYAMERLVGYTGYLIGFATGGMEVTLYYWAFVPLMAVIILYDTKRMLIDPIPPARAA